MRQISYALLLTICIIGLCHSVTAQAVTTPQTPSTQMATSPPQEAAEDGPPLKETMDWLKEKLSLNTNFSYREMGVFAHGTMSMTTNHIRHLEVVSVEGCTMELKTSDLFIFEDGERYTPVNQYKLILGDLEPFSAKAIKHVSDNPNAQTTFDPEVWDLQLRPAQGKTISTTVYSIDQESSRKKRKKNEPPPEPVTSPTSTGGVKQVFIQFIDREMAKRAAKAFEHAIQLCGGKADPF